MLFNSLSSIIEKILFLGQKRPLVVYWVMPVSILLIHTLYYYPFISDDAFISLRYSLRLLQGKGLSWNDDLPVEGYSNLGWVLLTSFMGKLGFDMIDAVRIQGIACFSGIMFVNYKLWHRSDDNIKHKQYLLAAQIFFALCSPVAIWSIGGLEQALVAFCLVSSIYYVDRYLEDSNKQHLFIASLLLAIMCITRPDSPLLCAGIAFGILWNQQFDFRKSFFPILYLAMLPVLFVLAQLYFRIYYYGEWVPNTAHIKIAPSLVHSLSGLLYLLQIFLTLFPWTFLLIKYLQKDSLLTRHRLSKQLLPAVVFWLIYLVFIGGDIFPGLRHFVVLLSALLLITPLLFESLARNQWYDNRKKVTACILLFLLIQVIAPGSLLAKFERWEWDGEVLSRTLRTAFNDEKPLMAMTAAGTFPYFTEFPSIDMLGLNDHYIAHNPAEDPSVRNVGHGHGNGEYVLQRKPDIVSFCRVKGSLTPCHVSGKQMFASKDFKNNYIPMKVTGYKPYQFTGLFWFRKTSELIGYRLSDHKLSIPGYLFSGNPNSDAVLNSNNKLSVRIRPTVPAIYPQIPTNKAIKEIILHASNSDQLQYTLIKNSDNTYDLKLFLTEEPSVGSALVESVDIILSSNN